MHPREVDEHFAHGTVTNYWGGASNATTHLLDGMHYRGLLRVTRRENGIRIYAAHEHAPGPADAAARRANLDLLVDVIVRKYAPLPAADAQHAREAAALRRAAAQARNRLRRSLARSGGSRMRESKASTGIGPRTSSRARRARRSTIGSGCSRRSTPSSGIVAASSCSGAGRTGSRRTTPQSKRRFGYYALPLLWREHVDRLGERFGEGWRAGKRARIRGQRGRAARPRFQARARGRNGADASVPADLSSDRVPPAHPGAGRGS